MATRSSKTSTSRPIRSRRHTTAAFPGLNKSLLALTALAAPLAAYAQQTNERRDETEVIDVTGRADNYNVASSVTRVFFVAKRRHAHRASHF